MSDVLRIGKRTFAWVTVVATIAWSIGLAAFVAPLTAQASSHLADGDLIKASLPAVYYYHSGKRYVFPNEKTYNTWYSDFSGVKTITNAELAAVPIGGNVTYRPGVKMVKITTDPKVYAVDAAGQLRWVTTEDAAAALYGSAWNTMVEDVPDAFFVNYKASETSGDIAAAADYDSAAATAAASSIGVDMGLGAEAEGAPAPSTPAPEGGALTVSLAPSNPEAGSLVTDAGNNAGGQRAKVLVTRFTAGDKAVQVDKILMNRSGIAADGDLDDMYLYDGDTLLAQSSSVSKGLATFTKSDGIFTVPAGEWTDVALWVDVNKDASSGITIGWTIDAADVTSTADSASGSAKGDNHTVAVVTDLAFVDVANVSPGAANSVDPQDDYDIWKFRLDANSQDMRIEKLTLTNSGSADDDDLSDLQLFFGGTQLGSTQGSLTGGAVTFDLTGEEDGGFKITAGQQRQLTLRADIVGGTNRTVRFGVQESTDVWAYDMNYNVYTVAANDDNNAFTVTQAGGATTINTATLTQTVATDSPSGNVADAATNILIAKYNFRASGEPVKVRTMEVSCTGNASTNVLANVKLLLDGSQVGSTLTTLTCDNATPSGTDFSFGNSFIVAAGETSTVEFRADLTNSTIASDDTVSATLVAGSSNAVGTDSLTSISTAAITGRLLTVKSGSVVNSANAALTNYTASRPLGVGGSANVRIGSFIITGGAEASEVSQIVIKDDLDTTSDGFTLADYFQNMKLMHGATQLGSTKGSLTDTDSTTYTYNIAPAITIATGETYVVDVYADILSTTAATSHVNTDDTNGVLIADSVVATGVDTGATTSDTSTDPQLQRLFIATNGMLRVTKDGDAASDAQLVLGSTDQELMKFDVAEQSNAEDILIKKFVVADTISLNSAVPFNATGTLRNLKLYNGSTLLGTVSALSNTTNSAVPIAAFDLTGLSGGGFTVKKGASVALSVKADMTPWLSGGSASTTHRIDMFSSASVGDYDWTANGVQDYVEATGVGSGFSISTSDATDTSGLVIGSSTGSSQLQIQGGAMDAVRTKISFAFSNDTGKVSPSGKQNASGEQTVAIFKVSNTANVGGYKATLKQLNLDINKSGLSVTTANTALLQIYRDSIDLSNRIANSTIGPEGISDTQLTEGNLTDIDVSAGASRYIYVTLDTSNAQTSANDTLSVGIQTGATGGQSAVQWSDGAMLTLTEVNGLPLPGQTITY